MKAKLRTLDEAAATPGSFHDCHVHGMEWRRDQHEFALRIQYIVEWIAVPNTGYYRFRVSNSVLVFRDVESPQVDLNWSDAALDCQNDEMLIAGSRLTPNGSVQRQFEVLFSNPAARVSLWASGYEVRLLQEPMLADTPWIPISD